MKKLTPAQRALAADNMGLVGFVLGRMCIRVSDEDAFAAGCVGLCKAAAHWSEKGGAAFSTYACRQIRNEVLNYRQREKTQKAFVAEKLDTLASSECVGFQAIEDHDLLRRIYENRDGKLNDDELSVIRLLIHGCSPKAVAGKLGIGLSAVYKLKKRAAEKLKN